MSDFPERSGDFIALNQDTVAVIAAARTNIAWYSEHQSAAHVINVDAVKRLLTYLTTHEVRTLYYSSNAVFNPICG